MSYKENEAKRTEIDNILRQIAGLESNLGIDSTPEERLDCKTEQRVLLLKIKGIDTEFFEVLCPIEVIVVNNQQHEVKISICERCESETKELYPCERCDTLIGACCQAAYTQFCQIDYNCCKGCVNNSLDNE